MENYTHPHVSMSTTALKRSAVSPSAEDTTVLFAPIMAKRGPADRIVVCHSLSEFIDTFGELDYEKNKLQTFNVSNWLSNGGTVYAKRLMLGNASKAYSGDTGEGSALFVAKYEGEWYNGITVSVKKRPNLDGYFDITVKHTENSKTSVLENFYRIKLSAIEAALAGSQFVTAQNVASHTLVDANANEAEYSLAHGSDGSSTADSFDELVEAYFTKVDDEPSDAEKDLGNKLETPIDIILDAGFSDDTKKAIADFVVGIEEEGDVGPMATAIRPDIFTYFDRYGIDRTTGKLVEGTAIDSVYSTNIALQDQTLGIYDAAFSDRDTTVCPSYFLSKLIPFNDLQYGIQKPTAGIRYGRLDDALSVNKNPRPAEKEALFRSRVNYIEKTSREYAFMSQRTHDGSTEVDYSALSFINNSRCLEKMKRDIERLGREYLFEFNDSVTLSLLSNILNKYIGGWISNRTLTSGMVQVSQDPDSSERVNVTLNIKFTGTIEVISVDIVIE